MAEYKEWEAVKSRIERLRDKCGNDEMAFALNWAIRLIEDIPAADVRPVVRGRWIDKPYTGGRRPTVIRYCSLCGHNNNNRKTNYCPNCGARMDGDGNG